MKIRFCGNNEGSSRVCKRLQADFPAADISREKCVKNCAICNCSLFALVAEKPLRAKNAEDLYANIAALLRETA